MILLNYYIYVCVCVCVCVCVTPSENPVKVIFCDLLFSIKKNHPSYGK